MSNLAAFPIQNQNQKNETPKTRLRSGTLASGITTKMDLFARRVAEGFSLADAYRAAFNTANMKPRTISNDASRLARHHGVSATITAYRAEIEARNRISALERSDRIWQNLWELIDTDETPPAVQVRALDLAARLCGMFKRPQDAQPLSVREVETELERRLYVYGTYR